MKKTRKSDPGFKRDAFFSRFLVHYRGGANRRGRRKNRLRRPEPGEEAHKEGLGKRGINPLAKDFHLGILLLVVEFD
jgi:hypothetical protein